LHLNEAGKEQLQQWESELAARYSELEAQQLNLDLTRGKPSPQQLDLSNCLDGILKGDYRSLDGTDTRNYGGLEGIEEARQLGADLLGVSIDEIIAGGNSSLTMMRQAMTFAFLFGPDGPGTAWQTEGQIKCLCPSPGYDRHFFICEDLGIEMIPVRMTAEGPDMDQVEELIRNDRNIKAMWCVPRFSNPTGIVYSDEVVERIAQLGRIAPSNFRIFWDNAYAVHDLSDGAPALSNVMDLCKKYGTENTMLQFASTSKITFAGAGIAFMAATGSNLKEFKKRLGASLIGPDKVNQLRHMRFLPDIDALKAHMKKHAALLRPRFAAVLEKLEAEFGSNDLLNWETPEGGYFVSVNTRPGLAKQVVSLAGEIGVKLTPAGATFPYGNDPQDRNIRLAPSFPSLEEIELTMEVFCTCVKLASVRQALKNI
jgi:aspartate/methionine/tyrosine aminotransferase